MVPRYMAASISSTITPDNLSRSPTNKEYSEKDVEIQQTIGELEVGYPVSSQLYRTIENQLKILHDGLFVKDGNHDRIVIAKHDIE